MNKFIIVAAALLNIQIAAGQVSGSTKCNSSLTSCTYNQIRCPANYYFNGQYCLPIQNSAGKPVTQPDRSPPQPTPTPTTAPCPTRPPAIVTPTNPDPLPVKPVCEPFYEWNGHECYKIVHNEPICPPGHNLTSTGECVSILAAMCQENYYQNGDFCVGLVEAPVECPHDYYWVGSMCSSRVIPTCPEGYTLNNGYCEIFDTGACPAGTFMDNFKCIGHHQIEIQCDFGYYWNGNYCENRTKGCEDGFVLVNDVCEQVLSKAADFECPPRTEKVNNECISIELICPKGFTLIGEVCVEQNTTSNLPSSNINNCTSGYKLVGCECVRDNITTHPDPHIIQCPPNYEFINGFCYHQHEKHQPPVCQTDHNFVDGKCQPKNPNEVPVCPPSYKLFNGVCVLIEDSAGTPTNCSEGHLLIYGVCVPIPQCSQNSSHSNVSTCMCPSGYNVSNGICVMQGNIPGTCHPRNQTSNENGSPNPNEPTTCSPGYKWINCTCVKDTPGKPNPTPDTPNEPDSPIETTTASSICAPGFKWVNSACINEKADTSKGTDSPKPNEPPSSGSNKCPSGFVSINSTCVSETTTEGPITFEPSPTPPTCDSGFKLINWSCVSDKPNIPGEPSRPGENQTSNLPTNPTIIPPCYVSPPISCQPCQPPSNQPPPATSQNPNCTQVSQQIVAKNGHISITNIVNIAHHHARRPANNDEIHILVPDHSEDYSDVHIETNTQNTTEEKCCEVITPRQCKQNGDEWTCFHRKYQRCGPICTQSKIFLKPRIPHYQPPILIMPPPPRRIYGRRRMFSGGATDCSGCIHGSYRCSVECYRYDCNYDDCAFMDQNTYCEDGDDDETEGCSADDGYYE